ncbi:MAG: type II toxin-antitoxin system RelE/ParE family toxin [Candidatus Syntrophosphaera sp.]|nr:type II toxin-antitoxin system RelE/ParE family toxin [Candidatus Syntrophosphaera sp.]
MKIVYYPGRPDKKPYTGLARFVQHGLYKKSPSQWEKMDTWMEECRIYDSSYLRKMIRDEAGKPWENRTIASLKDGLYEYRGKRKSQQGTIRLYFCMDGETLYVLCAEYKTGDTDMIETARERKKELQL